MPSAVFFDPRNRVPRESTCSYEELAEEYYDKRHVTSRNFDSATTAFFRQWKYPLPDNDLVLDLGAGRGTAISCLQVRSDRIVQADISVSMLNLQPREPCRARVQCDARALPFNDNTFAAVFALLYDPYNRPGLYPEIRRILLENGIFVGTLPHYVWGETLRTIRGSKIDKAQLINGEGRIVERDSFLMTDEEIRRHLNDSQLQLMHAFDLSLAQSEPDVSLDIVVPATHLGQSPHELPIVKLIIARKP